MSKRILIIEDTSDARDFFNRALPSEEYRVFITSRDGALLQLGLVQPNLIILALRMSNSSSWWTLQRIRELSSVPIIVLSTLDDKGIEVECLDRGADLCLTRPISVRELQARVRALLRRDQKPYPIRWRLQAAPI